MRRGDWVALGALALILTITVLWWALALWPLPASGPAWLLRTRAVCFGTSATGLPDGYGWMTLIGQPILLLGMLMVVWGDALRAGLGALARRGAGRLALATGAAVLVAGLAAAAGRVASAMGLGLIASTGGDGAAEVRRLNRPAPGLDLVDQRGESLTLARFRGRPVLLTFAYAHCETVCPLAVHDVLRARTLLADVPAVAIIVTLDPWRDTPARLPAIAERWGLGAEGFVASGDTFAVGAMLDRWNVAHQRDLRSGDLVHAPLVYLIARDGRVAYVVSGSIDPSALANLARRL